MGDRSASSADRALADAFAARSSSPPTIALERALDAEQLRGLSPSASPIIRRAQRRRALIVEQARTGAVSSARGQLAALRAMVAAVSLPEDAVDLDTAADLAVEAYLAYRAGRWDEADHALDRACEADGRLLARAAATAPAIHVVHLQANRCRVWRRAGDPDRFLAAANGALAHLLACAEASCGALHEAAIVESASQVLGELADGIDGLGVPDVAVPRAATWPAVVDHVPRWCAAALAPAADVARLARPLADDDRVRGRAARFLERRLRAAPCV